MTRRSPRDPALNRVIFDEIHGPAISERVVFIDHLNRLRAAVYVSDFGSGLLDRERTRLESEGVLKAVVHICAETMSDHGPYVSVVEYLPDGMFYTVLSPRISPPVWHGGHEDTVANTKKLFNNGEEETEP